MVALALVSLLSGCAQSRPEAFYNRGNAYADKGEYDRAIQDYDHAIRLDPTFALAFNNRGSTYADKGEYDRAIQDYDHAIRLDPTFALAFYSRGNAYAKKGEHDRAIQDYDQAIRLNPNNAEAFYNRGLTFGNKGEYDRAIQDYDHAIRLNPTFALAFNNRGVMQFDKGQFLAAAADFAKAVQHKPTDPYFVIWLYLAQSRAGQNGRDNLARHAPGLDLKQWPGPVVSLYQGKITLQAVLEAALDIDPKKQREQQCEKYFYAGQHLLIQGRKEEAVRMLRAAIDTCVAIADEYDSAKAELKRMGY